MLKLLTDMSDERAPLTLMSFGFKYGHPPANHYFDVTWIKNPARMPGCDLHSTINGKMVEYVLEQPEVQVFIDRAVPLILFLNDRDHQVVAFGCNSGRHRSPILVHAIAEVLQAQDIPVFIDHRDLPYMGPAEGEYDDREELPPCV